MLSLFVVIVVIVIVVDDGKANGGLDECYSITSSSRKRFQCYREALGVDRDASLLHLGIKLRDFGLEASLDVLQELTSVQSKRIDGWNELIISCEMADNFGRTIKAYEDALRMVGENAALLNNAGTFLYNKGQWAQSILYYDRAWKAALVQQYQDAAADPKVKMKATILRNLGNSYKEMHDLERASKHYQESLAESEDFATRSHLVQTLHYMCDWDNFHAHFEILMQQWRSYYHQNDNQLKTMSSLQPFDALGFPLSPNETLQVAQIGAKYTLWSIKKEFPDFKPFIFSSSSSKMMIGFVSAAFGHHPTTHLLGSALAATSKKFKYKLYSLIPFDNSVHLAILKRSVHNQLVSLHSLSHLQAAALINGDGPFMLIDLDGYTGRSRETIFAMKPAKIQMSFLGFHGSTGAPYIDYLLTDRVTSPPEYRGFYSESMAMFTFGSHFVADYRKYSRLPRKQEPGNKTIVCNIGQLYKIDRQLWGVWNRLLQQHANTTLRLLLLPSEAVKYLKYNGTSSVEFVTQLDKEEHLKRMTECKLYVDTPKYNSHTTATDALWSGVHMITLPLERMASRVAASFYANPLMHVARNIEDYHEMASRLLTTTTTTQKKLEATNNKYNRTAAVPFDVSQWALNFDRTMSILTNDFVAKKKYHIII